MIFVETAMTLGVINGFLPSLAPVVPGQIMLFSLHIHLTKMSDDIA